ncbi:MAG: DHHA1 domain-containing protein [Nanopusillaceae archaeon]
MILITHWDVDGVLCLYLFYKKFGDIFKVYFSGPRIINKTLAKLVYEGKNNEELYIADISPNQEGIFLASCFKKATWIDHHFVDSFEKTSRVNIYILNEKSAAAVVAKYFNLEDPIVKIADNIDSNNIKEEIERDFRDLISAIRFYNPKTYPIFFISIAKELYLGEKIEKIIEKRDYILKKFREYIKDKEDEVILSTKIHNFKNNKILIVEIEDNIPSFAILDILNKKIGENLDYVVILYENRGEIRTTTNKNVLEIAKYLGGGGHLYAAGFQFDSKEKVIEKIKEFFINNNSK